MDQLGPPLPDPGVRETAEEHRQTSCPDPRRDRAQPVQHALIESTNTKIRLITRMAFGFTSPDALIGLALLSLGGHRPALPGRK